MKLDTAKFFSGRKGRELFRLAAAAAPEGKGYTMRQRNTTRTITRREALLGMGALAAGAATTGLAGCASGGSATAATATATADDMAAASAVLPEGEMWSEDGTLVENVQRMAYPMRGVDHQPGVTGAQQNLQAVSFKMASTATRDDLVKLLKTWTKYAENMCAGFPVNEPSTDKHAAPEDSGECYDLGAAGLTITFGFGASLFETEDGEDRYGLAKIKPELLVYQQEKFAGDRLVQSDCGGDLFLFIAAEDPKVAFHAARNLIRPAYGIATIKWNKTGYYHTLSPEGYAHADRDLFGFRDGTTAPDPEDEEYMNTDVWIQPEDNGEYGDLFAGGTYMMWRAFDMKIESWDQQTLAEQERVIGRTKLEGIPLSGGEDETEEPDCSATDADGNLLIDPRSHVGLFASLRQSSGHTMFRWGWNFSSGFNRIGQLKAGMYTGSMSRDPELTFNQFMRLWRDCDLTDYMTFTSSAVWLLLPGLKDDQEYIGQQLFEATA